MSNWDRLAVMELLEAVQRAKLSPQTSEKQLTEIDMLLQRFGHKAKTIDVTSEDVRALRNAVCAICSLGDGCLMNDHQCGHSRASH